MTTAIWTLAIFGLILSVIGFKDIITGLIQFYRKGVVSRADFESKHPARPTACRVSGPRPFHITPALARLPPQNRLALKSNFTRPSGRTQPFNKTLNQKEF